MHLRNDGGPSFSRDGPEVYSFGNFPATQAPYIMGAKTSKDNTVGGAVGGMESGEFGKSGDFGSSSFLLAKEDDPPQGIPSSASAAKKQQQHSSRRPPDASIKTELATVLETSAATRPDLNASPSSAFTPSPPQTTKNTTTSKDSRGSGGLLGGPLGGGGGGGGQKGDSPLSQSPSRTLRSSHNQPRREDLSKSSSASSRSGQNGGRTATTTRPLVSPLRSPISAEEVPVLDMTMEGGAGGSVSTSSPGIAIQSASGLMGLPQRGSYGTRNRFFWFFSTVGNFCFDVSVII